MRSVEMHELSSDGRPVLWRAPVAPSGVDIVEGTGAGGASGAVDVTLVLSDRSDDGRSWASPSPSMEAPCSSTRARSRGPSGAARWSFRTQPRGAPSTPATPEHGRGGSVIELVSARSGWTRNRSG